MAAFSINLIWYSLSKGTQRLLVSTFHLSTFFPIAASE